MIFSATLVVALALTGVSSTPVSLKSTSTSSTSTTSNSTSYRSSTGGYVDEKWKAGIEKARSIVEKMTYSEKLVFLNLSTTPVCSGNTVAIPRLDLPAICFSDSPQGILSRYSSQFPSSVTRSATWNRDDIYDVASAMGKEFHDVGINTPLAVVVGPMGRSVYGGRNWEGFGPDPYFAGEAVRETVKGIQEQGPTANVKHFYGSEFSFGLSFKCSCDNATKTLLDPS